MMRYGISFAALVLAALPLAAQEPNSALSLDSLLNVTVSTAARYEQTVQQAPASVSVITAEEIERYAVQTLADALALVRGFYLSYDHNFSYVGVRGFSRPTDYNNRILLMINGQPLNEPEYGSAPFGTEFPLPLELVERIEVVRGPGSVLYGTGAMFAVVNVITRTAADQSRVRVVAEAGSTKRRSVTALGMYRFGDGGAIQLGLQHAQVAGADRYYAELEAAGVSDGVARGVDEDEYQNAYLAFSRRGLAINARIGERRKTIPTASWGTDFNHPDAWTLNRRAAVAAELRDGLSASAEVFFKLSYEHHYYQGSYPYFGTSYRVATVSNWGHAEAGLLWDISARHRLVAGLELSRVARSDFQVPVNGQMRSFDAPFSAAAIYGQIETALTSQLTAVLGLSHDERTTGNAFTTPRMALLYAPSSNTTLKALYGHAFRAPNPWELYSAKFIAGGEAADLSPERIITYELGVEQRLSAHTSLSGSVYYNKVTELIDYVPDPANPLGYGTYRNYTQVEGSGAELEVRLRDWKEQSAFVALTWQNAEGGAPAARLTNSPDILLKAGWHNRLSDRFGAGLLMQHETGRLTLRGGKTSAFTRFDGSVTTAFAPGLRATASIRNIFDIAYAFPGGEEHRQHSIPQDGRTFTLRLDAQLK